MIHCLATPEHGKGHWNTRPIGGPPNLIFNPKVPWELKPIGPLPPKTFFRPYAIIQVCTTAICHLNLTVLYFLPCLPFCSVFHATTSVN
jgi:hypothetical protein